eukprot:gene30289-37480_t
MDFHNVVECPDTLIDCPLFRANCCNVTDCAGVLRRGDYEAHLDATPHRATITSLLKRLHETQSELVRERKKQQTEVAVLPVLSVTTSHSHVVEADIVVTSATLLHSSVHDPASSRLSSSPTRCDAGVESASVSCDGATAMTSLPASGSTPHQNGQYTGERNATGQRHGQGRQDYVHSSAVYYEGQWVNDKRHGHGTLKTRGKLASLYVGEFANDFKHGHGVCTHTNGDVYT